MPDSVTPKEAPKDSFEKQRSELKSDLNDTQSTYDSIMRLLPPEGQPPATPDLTPGAPANLDVKPTPEGGQPDATPESTPTTTPAGGESAAVSTEGTPSEDDFNTKVNAIQPTKGDHPNVLKGIQPLREWWPGRR